MPLAFLWKISGFLCNLHIMQGFKPQALYLRNKLFWAWFGPLQHTTTCSDSETEADLSELPVGIYIKKRL